MNRITAGIKRFTKTPISLFRIQTTDRIRLGDLASQTEAGRSSYDLILKDGEAQPLHSDNYTGPNGASVRPFGKPRLEIISNWKGKNVKIIQIPEGTPLPEGTVLVHEFSDHHSLQTAKTMPKEELETKFNRWLFENGTVMSKDEFIKKASKAG